MRRKCFTGIEILLCIVFLAGTGSAVKNFSDRREMRKLSEQNTKQAVKIDSLVLKVDELNKTKDEIIAKKLEIESQLKKEAATGFSILYEQADDIYKENKTPYTSDHVLTAKKYIETWGYEAIARIIKWQQDAIDKQIAFTRELMEKNKTLEKEYDEYKIKTQEQLYETKKETEKHKTEALTLQNKISNFISETNWLQKIIFWCIVGTVGYLIFSFGGFGLLLSSRNSAITTAKHFVHKKNNLVKAIKTFTEVDDEGNETMKRVLNALKDDVDLDMDDEDENPVKHFKAKQKNKKKTLDT